MSRVVVLGNAGVDLLLPAAKLPRPGESLIAETLVRAPGGKGLNQAVAAARAGAEVHFCAPVGDDPDGRWLEAVLAEEGFAGLELPRLPYATDLSVIVTAPDGENIIVGAGPCADAVTPAEAEAFAARARSGDLLLVQGNLSLAATTTAVRAAAAAGTWTVFNTAPLRWPTDAVLASCRVAIANGVEAEAVTGEADPHAAARRLRAMGPEVAVVTLGAAGCVVAVGDAPPRALPAPRVQAVDTTGAGDAFCGAFAALLVTGADPVAAADAAQRAAAGTTTRRGAYPALPDRAAMSALLRPAAQPVMRAP